MCIPRPPLKVKNFTSAWDFSSDHIKGLPATTRVSRATWASTPREWLYREGESKKHFCAIGLQDGKGWLLRLCSWEPGWSTLTAGGCMLLHSLAVLHKSRKQLLLPSVLGHWVPSALSGSGCIWSATQHPPHPPAVAPAVPSRLELRVPSYTPGPAQHFSGHQGRHNVCIFLFLSKLLTLGQQLEALFTISVSQCEGQEWGRFAFQESHFFPMKSMHSPNTRSMFSTTDK